MTKSSYTSGFLYWFIHVLFVAGIVAFWFIPQVAVGYTITALSIVLLVIRIFRGDD